MLTPNCVASWPTVSPSWTSYVTVPGPTTSSGSTEPTALPSAPSRRAMPIGPVGGFLTWNDDPLVRDRPVRVVRQSVRLRDVFDRDAEALRKLTERLARLHIRHHAVDRRDDDLLADPDQIRVIELV